MVSFFDWVKSSYQWRLRVLVAAAVVIVVAAQPARAADSSDDKTAQARALSQEATAHYAVGEFIQAAEKYQAAYKLKADPALLYNAAQSYRLAGKNDKALLLYKNYVMFYPNARNVPNVQQQIAKLQEAIAAQEKAQTQPPTTTEPAGGAGGAVASSAPAVTSPPPATGGLPTAPSTSVAAPTGSSPGVSLVATPAPQTPSEPLYKKWWLWTAVGAAVAAGVVTTVVIASRPSGAWNTAPDLGPGATSSIRAP